MRLETEYDEHEHEEGKQTGRKGKDKDSVGGLQGD